MGVYTDTILNTAGLVAYWKLDETSGTTAVAQFGGINGTRSGVIYGGSPIVSDGNQNSVGFDGINDYVSFGNTFNFPNKAAYTIETWVWPVTAGGSSGFPTFLSNTQYATNTGGYEMYLDKANMRWVYSRRGANVTNYCYGPTGGVQNTTWCHIVARYDPGINQMRLIVNGELAGTASSSLNQGTTSQAFRLGSYAGGTDFFQGHLDEVAIYNVIVPMATLKEHYERGIANRWDHGSYAFIM